MTLQIYRIDRSLIGKVGHFLKPPKLPPAAAAAAGGLFGHIAQVAKEVMTENCYILHDDDEVKRFKNPLGQELLDNVYYIRHPKKARTDWLIPASGFHAFIVREQIADIVSYVRANTSVKRLRVSIESESGVSARAKAAIENLPLEGSASVKVSNSHEVVIECERPLKPSEKRRDYVWMDDFPSTAAAMDNVTGGRTEINERCDLSFGLDGGVAELVELSAEWMKTYRYHVSAELG